ncbi:hypothetical protein [Celeribacter neptunius]|uniref:50S ribosomal protein L35 n=1 Tax=Celeribacter neptunius TaxID=588602 RepID=A0A1I3UN87_9RHOB|nr:hypothetical protein [Celeribacter neptunius]SFJ84500.1 hypothetical protein SAMN04487991_3136 [Celeribacter neptunius]
METDLFLVLGMAILCLAVPAFLSAYSDARRPTAGLIMLALGAGAVIYAVVAHPGGYSLQDLPEVIFRVLAHYFRHLSQ